MDISGRLAEILGVPDLSDLGYFYYPCFEDKQ